MRGTGVDVLTLLPGCVATGLNGFKEAPLSVISAADCAKGTLNNATSWITYGGWVHELHSVLAHNLILDFIPLNLLLKLAEKIGQ